MYPESAAGRLSARHIRAIRTPKRAEIATSDRFGSDPNAAEPEDQAPEESSEVIPNARPRSDSSDFASSDP